MTRYAREIYLTASLLLSCDQSIYGKLIKYMADNYAMGQENYPWTLPKMHNLLSNWQHSARTTPIPPTGGLYFSQEPVNDEGTELTNKGSGVGGGHNIRPDI